MTKMRKAPKGMRVHIAIFGRRNAGKSSLLNALTRQQVSIVSDIAGTTTDPVEKPMELLPIGPVLFIDTAGIDDEGALGELRIEKTKKIFERTDIGIIVADAAQWGTFEEELIQKFQQRQVPFFVVFNKTDLSFPKDQLLNHLDSQNIPIVKTVAIEGEGIPAIRETLLRVVPDDFLINPAIVGDLIPPGELVVLVVPIDKEAPKGRLIMPQVQTIRDILDHDSYCMVVKDRELRDALDRLNRPPALVVTDSQAFLKVSADTPPDIPLTSFSILFARLKGELDTFVRGAAAIEHLKTGDHILMAEACTHHPIADDIGRVKIPRWLTQYVGGKLEFTHVQGHDFPDDLTPYKLVIHCGSCTFNKRALLSRLLHCRNAGIPITNYGVAIAYTLGILNRALTPFPSVLDTLQTTTQDKPLLY
jgi:[FeFe] hydrogenase H-cluster maturation GTPase HydF